MPDQEKATQPPKLCKSVWTGTVCSKTNCDLAHPPKCLDPACHPRRQPECSHWHTVRSKKDTTTQGPNQAVGKLQKGEAALPSNKSGCHNSPIANTTCQSKTCSSQSSSKNCSLPKRNILCGGSNRQRQNTSIPTKPCQPSTVAAKSDPSIPTPAHTADCKHCKYRDSSASQPCSPTTGRPNCSSNCREPSPLVIMTWNAAGLNKGMTKELALVELLQRHSVDVAAISEAELDVSTALTFAIEGYTTFIPPTNTDDKIRVLLLVRTSLAISANATLLPDATSGLSVWVDLHLPHRLCIGGVYRPWKGIAQETRDLQTLIDQVNSITSSSKDTVLLGDFNLDTCRENDPHYTRRQLLTTWIEAMQVTGLQKTHTPPTWISHGSFGTTGRRTSTIDHVYHSGLKIDVTALEDSTTDHRPLLAVTAVQRRKEALKTIHRRNFKAIQRWQLEEALNAWPWADIHTLRDVEKIHSFLTHGITFALDEIAPVKAIKVRPSSNTYLSKETKAAMAARDKARSTRNYRLLRNKAASLVRRDKIKSNLKRLQEARGNPKTIWGLANSALGRPMQTPLPSSLNINGVATETSAEAATGLNEFYINKVHKLRAAVVPKSASTPKTESLPHQQFPQCPRYWKSLSKRTYTATCCK